MICREFGLDSRTLGKRLADAELDHKEEFGTQEIFAALVGDLSSERIRLTREQADKIALENAESRRELIRASELLPMLERGIGAIKAHILSASNIEREDKDKILLQCKTFWDGASELLAVGGSDVESTAEPEGQ